LETLLFPEEVISRHHGRYIAQKLYHGHVLRGIYEYVDGIPTVVTVYFPHTKRYFKGEKIYEDKILR